MKIEDIKSFWEEAGRRFMLESKITPTSRDPYLALLERGNILKYLKKNYITLEIGCGDGLNTIHYSEKVKKMYALDVAESLIKIARERSTSMAIHNTEFTVGSVLNLKKIYPSQRFHCVISQRCLINLPEWQYQQDALIQIHDLLEKGGIFLLTEGFQKELDNLNIIREKLGLKKIIVVDYNFNMAREVFEPFIKQYFDIIDIQSYGTYLFLSRVLHPVAVFPKVPKHDSKLNEAAMKVFQTAPIEELDKYSYNLFYILRKRE